MRFIIFCVTFWAYYSVLVFVFANIIYPLLYSTPMSIYFTMTGHLKAKSIFISFYPSVVWTVFFVGGITCLSLLGTYALPYEWYWDLVFGDSATSALYLAIVILVGKLVLEKYRGDIRAEYFFKTYANNLTPNAATMWGDIVNDIEQSSTDVLMGKYLELTENSHGDKFLALLLSQTIKMRQ